jgi:hypothetical protein
MPSKSKTKGSGLEREIAKYLSSEYNESFIRNISGSGSFIGGQNVYKKNTLSESQIRNSKGDIVPPDSWSNFNAEVKFYADIPFHQFFNSCQQLDDWLKQMMMVSDPTDVNILFFKINRKGKYVVVEDNKDWVLNFNYVKYKSWYVIDFDLFFKYNKQILEKYCKG